jgi:hypothetical protein
MRKIISTLIFIGAVFSFAHGESTICFFNGVPILVDTKPSDCAHICPMGTPAAIDGDASDWGTTWLQMDQQPTSNSTTGMTAKFQMEYDQSNLYLVFVVTDDTPGDTALPNTYERDCVEVMMSLDTNSSGGMTGMFLFRRVYGWDGVLGQPGGNSGITDGTVYGSGPAIPASWNGNPSFKVKEIIDGNTYTQEWQIPWDSLMVRMNPPWDHQRFKLEVQASDNTKNAAGGRTQQRFWFGNSNNAWNNSAYQQVVHLNMPCDGCDDHPPIIHPGINTLLYAGDLNIFADGNYLKFSRNISEISIYNATGQLVLQASKIKNINIGELIKGFYIARIEGRSYKFIR